MYKCRTCWNKTLCSGSFTFCFTHYTYNGNVMTIIIHCTNSFTLKKLLCMCLFAFSQNYIMFFLCNQLWGDTIQTIILKCSPIFLNLNFIYLRTFYTIKAIFNQTYLLCMGFCLKHITENMYHMNHE